MDLVLIVDDSRVARMALRRLVKDLCPDSEIIEAGSYDEALVRLSGATPGAALIDYNMPDHTGLELAEVIVRDHPGMRLALVTANIQDTLAERARALGMKFIPKPPDPQSLGRFLRGEE